MSDIFKAIAHPTRREILLMLAEQPDSINNISTKFNMTRPAVAKHLKILEASGLVGIELDTADGRQRNCFVQLEALQEVQEYLAQLEKFWKTKLTGLGNYLTKNKEK